MTIWKCRQCDQKAVINMRHHKLALCEEHYTEWFLKQTEKVIKKYKMFTPEEKILLAVSGGKDSLTLWDVLSKLGYKIDGLYINLGINTQDSYSSKSFEYTETFAKQRNLQLIKFDLIINTGFSILEIANKSKRGIGRPCSVCGLIKRHVMNKIATENNYTVLATGHNLDDEVATLFSNTLTWSIGILDRQSPVLFEADGFARKVKPLCRFHERETAAYALIQGIDYIYEECPYSKGSKSIQYKHIMNDLEEKQPGTKLKYYVSFLNAQKNGFFFQHNTRKMLDTVINVKNVANPPLHQVFVHIAGLLKV